MLKILISARGHVKCNDDMENVVSGLKRKFFICNGCIDSLMRGMVENHFPRDKKYSGHLAINSFCIHYGENHMPYSGKIHRNF